MIRESEVEEAVSVNKKTDIWIDCDPGIDDAIALAMAASARDQLNLLGISTVAGNQSTEFVTDNALRLAAFFDMEEVPVVRGAVSPLVRTAEPAAHVHGQTGLGNYMLPPTTKPLDSESGIYYMYQCIMDRPEEKKVTLVPTGPLTNIALLLRTFPEVKKRIERIVFMGGSSVGGNVTPTAEFNIYSDPEAAQIVCHCGLPLIMCGLDVTRKSGLTRQQIKALCESGSGVEQACGQMLSFYLDNAPDASCDMVPIHDAVTILYLTDTGLFSGRDVTVEVDCAPVEGRGTTICQDRKPDGERVETPVYLLNQVDALGFQNVVLQRLKTLC